MNNVHDDQPVVFQTRWALSYLRGPLTREQIQTLMAPRKQAQASVPGAGAGIPAAASSGEAAPPPNSTGTAPGSIQLALGTTMTAGSRPVVPPDVPEFFIPRRGPLAAGATLLYRPALLGVARLHYADKKAGVDHWETLGLLRPIGEEMPADVWKERRFTPTAFPSSTRRPSRRATFAPLAWPIWPGPSAMPSGPKT